MCVNLRCRWCRSLIKSSEKGLLTTKKGIIWRQKFLQNVLLLELNVILYTLEFGCQTNTQESKPTIKAKSKSKHTSACIVTSAFNSPIYKNKFSLTSKGFNRVKGKTWHFFQFTREKTCRKNTHSPKIRLDTGFLCTNKQLLWNEPLCSNFRAPKIKKSNQSP